MQEGNIMLIHICELHHFEANIQPLFKNVCVHNNSSLGNLYTLQHFQCKSCSKSMMSILFLYPQFTFLTWYILHVFVERTSLVKKYITLYYIYTLCYRTRDSRWFLSKSKYPTYLSSNILDNSSFHNDNWRWIHWYLF